MPTRDPPTPELTESSARPRMPPAPRGAIAGILVRTAIALSLLGAGAAAYGVWAAHGGGWVAAPAVDSVSDADREQRQRAFEALGVTTLLPVDVADTDHALDAMDLAPGARQALQSDLARPPEAEAAVSPAPAAAQPQQVRLAWIRLWDSEVEDGDVVRIDSAGYSRTVTLTRRGTTLAVPVSPGGILTVTGIRDGDGGGITVGLASGASTALLPIMSTGQTLRIAVTLP